MAVRRKKAEGGEGASLDSLMDALTNVVAVLIFVLLLVNCEVSQKVVKMMEDLVPVTEEQIRQVQEMLKQIEIDKQKMEELLKQPKPSQVDFDELQKAIELLQKQKEEKLKQNNERSAAQAELKKLHDEALAARDAEQKKNIAMQEEIRRLEILLDTTPVEKDIPPTEITIPATRPIPEGAKMHHVYVVDNQVVFPDFDAVMAQLAENLERIKKNKDDFLAPEEEPAEDEDKKLSAAERRAERERKKAEAKAGKPLLFDKDKVMPELAKLKAPGPGRWAVFSHPWWGHATAEGQFWGLKEGATTLEQLKQPGNPFASALNRVRPPNGVVFFHVHPESLYAYALAREIVDSKRIPCGWEITGTLFVRLDVPGLAVKPTGPAPARDPNYKPPEAPRATGQKLD